MRIYSVEDDQSIRELIVYALKQSGYDAAGFESGDTFWAAMREKLPDLALLDVMLPGEDGFALLARLRADERTRAIPVIMLTAKGTEMDKVQALDGGADDYVVKPFGVMELLSRVRAVLRRGAPSKPEQRLMLGGIELDADKRTVLAGGQPVTLTFKEFELLHKLMANKGIVFSRDKLLDSVWGVEFAGDTRTVDVHVATLRQKLGDAGGMIHTVRGVGYRMEE